MNAAKTLIASLLLAAASLAPAAHATVINFNGLAGTNLAGSTYVQAGVYSEFSSGATHTGTGFKFTGQGYDYVIGTRYSGSDAGGAAFNGTDYFLAFGSFTITSATSSPFVVNGLDLAKWEAYNSGGQATLTGQKVGGGTVTRIIELSQTPNQNKQMGNDFGTYTLSGFDNLTSLTISRNFSEGIAMDNLIVNATSVPEPSSLALFGLAVAAGAFARRRAGKAS